MDKFSYRVKLRDMVTGETQTITVVTPDSAISIYGMQRIVRTLEDLDLDDPQVIAVLPE